MPDSDAARPEGGLPGAACKGRPVSRTAAVIVAASGVVLLLGCLAYLSPDGRRHDAWPPAALPAFPGYAWAHVPDAAVALTAAGNIGDDGSLELSHAAGVAAFESDCTAYLAVAAYPDYVQMLNVAGQTDPVPAGRIDDASSLELYAAAFESPDGATYLAVAAYCDDGVQIFRLGPPTNQPLAVSAVTDMAGMFSGSFEQNLGGWYIVPAGTTVDAAGAPGTVAGISAQNAFLDRQNPSYGIGTGGDSDLLGINGTSLVLEAAASALPARPTHAVNITSTGDFGANSHVIPGTSVTGTSYDSPPVADAGDHQSDPGTGTPQYERTCLALRDGYVFGSEYCLPDARIQPAMDGIIRGFGEGGTESLDTALGQDGQLTWDAAFGVVLDRADAGLMAMGVTGAWLEDLNGLPVEADSPMITARHEVHRDRRAWLERVTANTGTAQVMGRLRQPGGDCACVPGHYMPDAEARSAVDWAVAAYRLHGRDGFGAATPEGPVGMRDGFAFVLDGDGRVVAHGADPGMVGAATALPSTKPGWADGGAARAWLYRHDGYLSGTSYDIRDAGAEAVVRNMARLDDAGHDVVDLVRHRHVPGDVMPFVIDMDGNYLAHPGFRAGAPSGMPVPEDGAGTWHASVWPVPGGGPGVRRGALGLNPMAEYCRGTCCIP